MRLGFGDQWWSLPGVPATVHWLGCVHVHCAESTILLNGLRTYWLTIATQRKCIMHRGATARSEGGGKCSVPL
jgi:hypothetical protein